MRRPTPVAVLWGTGALAILAAEQGWWSATAGAATVTLSGAQATDGLARSLALVALVGVLLTLTLRAFGRRVVASALGATYVGIALLGLGRPAPGADVVAAELSAATFADVGLETERAILKKAYGDKGLFLALEQEPHLQGAIVSLDPWSGYVVAMIGGYDFDASEFNRSFQSCRQPGSAPGAGIGGRNGLAALSPLKASPRPL